MDPRAEAIREWNAMTEAAHKKWGSLSLTEPEVVIFLTNMAAVNHVARLHGTTDPIIDAVENYLWWDTCNALSRENRVMMQKAMAEEGIPLPPHPGDPV